MRDEDRVRIRHMVDAIECVGLFLDGRARGDLDMDRMLLFAVLRAVEVLGEAAGRISEETRMNHPDIPWIAATSMRNRLIHGYFDVNTEIVWKTATSELPALLPRLRVLLEKE